MRRIVFLLVTFVLTLSTVVAVTDPTPNPFALLKSGEVKVEAVISKNENEMLTVRAADGKGFSAKIADVFRYRDGASVPGSRELRVGDRGRAIGTTDGKLVVFQDTDLILSDVVTYGWIRAVTPSQLTLETVAHKKVPLFVDAGTAYFSAPEQPLIGYTPKIDTAVRVHAVVNPRTHELFAYTRDTYIRLATEAEMTVAREKASADEAAAIDAAVKGFADVPSDFAYRSAVGFVKKEGIVKGYADGTYRPDQPVNRAEFVQILIGARFGEELKISPSPLRQAQDKLSLPKEGGSVGCFSDVDPTAWFAPAVCLAKTKSVIGGYADGTFQPAKSVNLAEALKIVATAFGWELEKAPTGAAWYEPYRLTAVKLNVLPDGFGAVGDALTRGQLAELITRAVKRERGELDGYVKSSTLKTDAGGSD